MKTLKTPGNISEVFASIGGEGLSIGSMQLFIRLAACSGECRFCAGKGATQPEETFAMRPWPGPRIIKVNNHITPEKLLQKMAAVFHLDIFHRVSFIGGEPLCQKDFVISLAELLRQKSVRLFADTQRYEIDKLPRMLPLIDDWSFTLNYPGKTSAVTRLQKKIRTLAKKADPANCYFKLIINSDGDPGDFITLFSQIDLADFTLVLQPNTSGAARINDWDTGTILEWVKIFQPYFAQVRWIPQVHKLLRIP